MTEQRDLTGQAVLAVNGLGYVTRSGVGPGGAYGHWIVDRTGDPGAGQSLPTFAPDHIVKPAVVGETVCPRTNHLCPYCELPHICGCGLRHFPARVLRELPRAGA